MKRKKTLKIILFAIVAAALACALRFVCFHGTGKRAAGGGADKTETAAAPAAGEDETNKIIYNTWIAKNSFKASDAANWSGGVPKEGDHILLSSVSKMDLIWDADGDNSLVATVASWTQERGYNGTVIFNTTYDDRFPVFTVTSNVVFKYGVWKHANNTGRPTHYLNIAVGGDFEFGPEALVDVNDCGMELRRGPGYTRVGGGSHGGQGRGGQELAKANPNTYGSVMDPRDLGSSGWAEMNGLPGAVCLAAGGVFKLDGRITANGTGWWNSGGGTSGGSVNIRAGEIAPGSHGFLGAGGGTDGWSGCGGGGRVAIRVERGAIPERLYVQAHDTIPMQADESAPRGAAGTIYTETEAGKAVSVRNNVKTQVARTAIPAFLQPGDADGIFGGDDPADFADVDLRLTLAAVEITRDIAFASLEMDAESAIHLEGATLRVRSATTGGERVADGTYSGNSLPAGFADASKEKAGRLVVGE